MIPSQPAKEAMWLHMDHGAMMHGPGDADSSLGACLAMGMHAIPECGVVPGSRARLQDADVAGSTLCSPVLQRFTPTPQGSDFDHG